MRLFTPRQFKKPSEWIKSIPLLKEALINSLSLHPVNLRYIQAIFKAFETLLMLEAELKKEIEIYTNRNEEEPLYPVKLTEYEFFVVEKILYNNWLETGS